MNTRYTTKKEKAAIKQAIKLFNEKASAKTFANKGWSKNKQGSFKSVYIKDGVVIKIGPIKQIVGEEQRWKKTKPHNKKYLARVFGRAGNMIVQRKVKVCSKSWKCKSAEVIAKKLKLEDWGHNHGHDTDGTPKFFDCVITKDMNL